MEHETFQLQVCIATSRPMIQILDQKGKLDVYKLTNKESSIGNIRKRSSTEIKSILKI